MNDTSRPIASISKNARDEIRIELSEFKGHELLQLRVWAKKADGTQIPTKSGFGLRASLIPALRQALAEAEAEARKLGWLEGG